MMYKRRIYIAVLKLNGKPERLYSSMDFKKLEDTLKLVYDIELNHSRIFNELRAPSVIYEERKGGYRLKIHKLVCA